MWVKMQEAATQKHNGFYQFVDEINAAFLDTFGTKTSAVFTEVIIDGDSDRRWFCVFSEILEFPRIGYVLGDEQHKLLNKKYKHVDISFDESTLKKIQYRVFYLPNASINLNINTFVRLMSRKLEIIFRNMIENLADEIKLISIDTRDLPSFLHKSIKDILPKYLSFGGASAFYYDQSSDALTLGATTGLVMQKGQSDFRRGAIKYYLDDKSYSISSFNSEECKFEYSKDGALKSNTFGEDVSKLFQRTYFPIMIRNALLEKAHQVFSRDRVGKHAVGVLRIINVSTYGMKSPLSLINYCILKHFCELLSILGERYQTASRVLHDMERATHGFSTDLTTLRLAVQLAHRYQDSFSANEARLIENLLDTDSVSDLKEKLLRFLGRSSDMRREVDIQLRNALAVQDSMAFQVLNVHMHSERSVYSDRFKKNTVCREPYREVFMRVSGSLEAMSQTYDRKRVRLEWSRPHNYNGVQDLPTLAVPSELLYLVVRNLIENSIKYCPINRPPRVEVDWRVSRGMIYFGFRDNGIGISKSDEQKIFRDGWRARVANELSFRGNGLGLAVCKSVLADFGGDLSYAGKGISGQGAQFNLRLGTHQ